MTREYGQFCGLARALELIGGRWTLLIIRELLVGPRRYTELEDGLPGIPSNVLSSRLRELEDNGLVERVLQARPSRSVAYALTPYGLDLWDPMSRLGLWGARSLGKPRPGDFFSIASLELALRATFDADAAHDGDTLFEIRLANGRLYVHVRDRAVSFPSEPSSPSNLVLETTPEVFAELFAGYTDIDAAVASRRARVDGPKREGRRFFRLFHLPAEPELTR
jgi:DNA-binding HxlR family transcriptional regulator/putative sterol carrier protein